MKYFNLFTSLVLSSFLVLSSANAAEPKAKPTQSVQQSAKTKDNHAYVLVKYSVENKSNKSIKSLYWIAAYLYDQQMIYSQDVPLNFAQPMAPKAKITVNLRIPFNQIPEQYRSLFTHLQEPIQVYSVARNVTFADGQQINVAN